MELDLPRLVTYVSVRRVRLRPTAGQIENDAALGMREQQIDPLHGVIPHVAGHGRSALAPSPPPRPARREDQAAAQMGYRWAAAGPMSLPSSLSGAASFGWGGPYADVISSDLGGGYLALAHPQKTPIYGGGCQSHTRPPLSLIFSSTRSPSERLFPGVRCGGVGR